jgi:hypothetical protein
VDHLAGLLQLWGEQRGLPLQLGCFLGASDAVGQILFPSDNHVTIWIHNDNAIQLSGANFNHYSGVDVLDSVLPNTGNGEWEIPQPVATDNFWGNDDAVGLTKFENDHSSWEIAPGFQFEGKTEEAQEDPVVNAKVAWTAGQNKLDQSCSI